MVVQHETCKDTTKQVKKHLEHTRTLQTSKHHPNLLFKKYQVPSQAKQIPTTGLAQKERVGILQELHFEPGGLPQNKGTLHGEV